MASDSAKVGMVLGGAALFVLLLGAVFGGPGIKNCALEVTGIIPNGCWRPESQTPDSTLPFNHCPGR